jgi:hypothetical protein
MGKKKVKNWQYRKRPTEEKRIDPGLAYAMTMAQMQVDEEKRIRKAIAVDNVVHDIQKDYTEGVANWFYGLLALALHDEGWGAKRILRVEERVRDYFAEYNSPDFGDFDLWQVVRDEVGLDFDPGECGMRRWKSMKEGESA